MNQYCRYCAYALDYNGEETDFLCELKNQFFKAEKAKRPNKCKDFDLNTNDIFRTLPNGDFAQYKPRAPYKPRTVQAKEAGQLSLIDTEGQAMNDFNEKDKAMMDEIKANPDKYLFYIDNDCISVRKTDDKDFSYDFSEYGYYFALQLLRYMGISADMV